MLHSFRALSYTDYRIFLSGQGVALIGTWCQRIALIWLVYEATGSPFLLGLVAFTSEIPFLLISPVGGVIADRLDQKKSLIIIEIISAMQAFVLAGLVLADTIDIAAIIFLALVQGVCQALDMPLRQSLFPKLIPNPRDLPNAVALMAIMNNAGRLIGPIVAGLLISVIGEAACFVVSGVGYMMVIVVLCRITIAPHPSRPRQVALLRQLRCGLQYAWSTLPIRAHLLILCVCGFCFLPYLILVPVYTTEIIGGTSQTLGYLLSSAGMGALVGLAWIARQTEVARFPRVAMCSMTLGCSGILLLSQTAFPPLAFLALAMVGIGIAVTGTTVNIYLQLVSDVEKRGRILGLFSTAMFGIAPLGNFAAGAIMEYLGPAPTLLLLGILSLSCTTLFALSVRQFTTAVAQSPRPDALAAPGTDRADGI